MRKKTIDQIDVKGKRVLVRVDFNVPLDGGGGVTDDRRIRLSLPTLRSVLERGGRLILMSHLGRPQGKGFEPDGTLRPVATRLQELLGAAAPQGVQFPSNDAVDDVAAQAVARLSDGGVVLLENLRFHKGEKKGDPGFAAKLAAYGDVYCNDAFGTSHRADASMYAVPLAMKPRPCVAGQLLAAELEYLMARLESPARPFAAILGGAKIADKLEAITNLMAKVDILIVGGAMAYTLLKAQGIAVGSSLVQDDFLGEAKKILAASSAGGCKVLLPVDHVCGQKLEAGTPTKTVTGAIPDGWMGLDIGPDTVRLFSDAVRSSKTLVWNGPMGAFETPPFDDGTRAIAKAAIEAAAKGAVAIAGGGDTAASLEEFGLAEGFSHVSTGGGASLEVLEGKHLVCLDALDDA
ncbi:MAG: phosphoglycerate kinase [Phycisphaerae bacterium]|nr:phosphoglycerate kinase [Phycisphaerae bacterium]